VAITQITSFMTEDGMVFSTEEDAKKHDCEIWIKNKLFKLLYNEFDTKVIAIDDIKDWMIRDAVKIVEILENITGDNNEK
jgi:hypothetical protein